MEQLPSLDRPFLPQFCTGAGEGDINTPWDEIAIKPATRSLNLIMYFFPRITFIFPLWGSLPSPASRGKGGCCGDEGGTELPNRLLQQSPVLERRKHQHGEWVCNRFLLDGPGGSRKEKHMSSKCQELGDEGEIGATRTK